MKFIEVVKQLDPLDPLVLKQAAAEGFADQEQLRRIAEPLHLRQDEVAVSLANLEVIGLARRGSARDDSPSYRYISVTPLGRELLLAVEPKLLDK